MWTGNFVGEWTICGGRVAAKPNLLVRLQRIVGEAEVQSEFGKGSAGKLNCGVRRRSSFARLSPHVASIGSTILPRARVRERQTRDPDVVSTTSGSFVRKAESGADPTNQRARTGGRISRRKRPLRIHALASSRSLNPGTRHPCKIPRRESFRVPGSSSRLRLIKLSALVISCRQKYCSVSQSSWRRESTAG